ncbi:MAG TPA: NAD(P)-binding domain-containing protein, partial [Microbacterium sp.]|nr:NAD(P)-binding domain-containing protein [Microbacterium sp.]
MDRTRTAGRSETPFQLRMRTADGIHDLDARAVIDASGTYRNPNPLGSNGLEPRGIADVADRVTHALPDVLRAERHRFARRHVTVVGAGHSAANTLLALGTLISTEPGTRVTWAIRHDRAVRVFTAETDQLTHRASLGAKLQKLVDFGVIEVVDSFEIDDVTDAEGRVALLGRRRGQPHRILTDIVVNATGFRPDLSPLREIRLDLDDIVESPRRLAPLIDPNVHSCGTVEPHGFAELRHPEPDFFLAGMKSYGRAPTFLLATGYEQIRSIVAHLDGDVAAATDVRLTLPATGVCSTDPSGGRC